MSDIAADKPGILLFVSEHAGEWARFKWLLPVLITVVVTMALLVHYGFSEYGRRSIHSGWICHYASSFFCRRCQQ